MRLVIIDSDCSGPSTAGSVCSVPSAVDSCHHGHLFCLQAPPPPPHLQAGAGHPPRLPEAGQGLGEGGPQVRYILYRV